MKDSELLALKRTLNHFTEQSEPTVNGEAYIIGIDSLREAGYEYIQFNFDEDEELIGVTFCKD